MRGAANRRSLECEKVHKLDYYGNEFEMKRRELLEDEEIIDVKPFSPGARNINAKNQELLRQVETHLLVI